MYPIYRINKNSSHYIGDANDFQSALRKISKDISHRGYDSYYIRIHKHDGTTVIDYGSHSEFYHIKNDIPIDL